MAKLVLLAVLCGVAPLSVWSQEAELAAGAFLVAGRDLQDPNFSETVILLLHYDEDQGAMGLVINRRTELTLGRVFEDFKEAKGRTDCAYMGGPVEQTNVLALLRTSVEPDNAERIFSSVYLLTSKDVLQKTLSEKADASVFHVYLGYAGWGPGQLEHEVSLGAWHILRADAGTLFDGNPDTVWSRLIRRTEMQIARRSAVRRRLVDADVVDGHLLRKNRRVIG